MGFTGVTTFPFGSNENIGTLLAANGYTQLESGLILQWGFENNLSSDFPYTGQSRLVTFPVAFPNAIVNIQITAKQLLGNPDGNALAAVPFDFTNSLMYIAVLGGQTTQTNDIYWFAMGY